VAERAARTAVLDVLARHVGFDAHVFALTDPASGVVSSPHATLPDPLTAQLPTVIRRRYLDDDAGFRAWLRSRGVADTVVVPLADPHGHWGFLELWRTAGAFSDAERAGLAALAPTLARGLRTTLARTFADDGTTPSGGVAVLDDDLQVVEQTDRVAAALLALLPPGAPVPPVPAAALNVGAALLAGEQGRDWRAYARVHLAGSSWLTVTAERLGERIAVSLTPTAGEDRVDLVARCHGLTPREREVLDLALLGLDSRGIAERLVIAPTTAEDHLKSLLAKTGAPSRQVMLVRALGEVGAR
jgi:DNA-binding CsgD family transcriptional regulator